MNLNSTDLTQTIELAANLGGDTDTIATISASLFMAGHQHALVPADWYQCLCHVEVAERIVGPFAKQFAS
ncbi:hypothetical protein [Lactiplantibacillus songbeiensis]|uniref:ADP-ribosylglycohydrolase n=1 Tax=Lactiplantibacillus songbeiensis TaxID=2559920 RepID=A0ABW4C2F6_9LACO|nr:hypothetical protein [Lactiplantibacillus songbeiensis]